MIISNRPKSNHPIIGRPTFSYSAIAPYIPNQNQYGIISEFIKGFGSVNN